MSGVRQAAATNTADVAVSGGVGSGLGTVLGVAVRWGLIAQSWVQQVSLRSSARPSPYAGTWAAKAIALWIAPIPITQQIQTTDSARSKVITEVAILNVLRGVARMDITDAAAETTGMSTDTINAPCSLGISAA